MRRAIVCVCVCATVRVHLCVKCVSMQLKFKSMSNYPYTINAAKYVSMCACLYIRGYVCIHAFINLSISLCLAAASATEITFSISFDNYTAVKCTRNFCLFISFSSSLSLSPSASFPSASSSSLGNFIHCLWHAIKFIQLLQKVRLHLVSFAFHLANAFSIFIYLSFFSRCYCHGAANAANEQCLIISSFYARPHFIKCLISFAAPNCHFALIVLAFFNSFCVTVASTSASTNLSSCCHCCFFWTIRPRGRATVIEIKCFKSNIILIIHKENNGKNFCCLIPLCSS